MTSKKRIKNKDIFSIQDRMLFEKQILHSAFISHVQNNMNGMKNYQLAKKVGVSNSFISQLFTGDKFISLELMVKFQRALNFRFEIQQFEEHNTIDNGIREIAFSNHETVATTARPLTNERIKWEQVPFKQTILG